MPDHEPPEASSWEQAVPPDIAATGDHANWYFHHVRRRIPHYAGQGSHSVPGNVSFFTSADPALTTTLWLRVGSQKSTSISFAVTGPNDLVHEEKPRWRAVLASALQEFRSDPPQERPWAAILVPKAAQHARWYGRFRAWPDRLSEPVRIGPITLTSVPTWVSQPHPHPDDMSVALGVGYWPLLVTGTAPGYYRAGALQAAARDLLHLQWLLTVVTARSWQRGRQPHLMEPDDEAEDFLAHWLEGMSGWSIGEHLPPRTTALELPGWLLGAWSKSLASRRYPHALSAYGRAFEHFTEESTSDAGARFAAVIEALSGTRTPTDAEKTAARHLLSAAAPGTLAEAEAMGAAKEILMYSIRSETVHTGRLHGPESLGGQSLGMVSADGDPSRIHHMMTGNLQHLCRNILVEELGGPVHDPEPILRELNDIRSGVIVLGPPIPR